MISVDDYLTTQGRHPERLKFVDDEIRKNAAVLLDHVNAILAEYGHGEKRITSGYRDPTSNAAAGGAKYSWHMRGLAVDIDDLAGNFGAWLMEDESRLRRHGLYAEDPRFTKSWVHLQTEPPRSGKRIFRP